MRVARRAGTNAQAMVLQLRGEIGPMSSPAKPVPKPAEEDHRRAYASLRTR
jgi:hypothetical protein